MTIDPQDALDYHSSAPAGKLAVVPTKPCLTQRDLSLAYTPGVAVPCLEIARDPSLVYKYTGKGNLVAVVTNGTAVLGLGNIGPAAGKPVMEGKGVLFKRFADIDVFDIELATTNADEIVRACQMLEPTFGGINLEDIKAPGMLLHRRRMPAHHADPRLPRRSAWHRYHLRRRPAERPGSGRQAHRQGARGFQRRRRQRASPARSITCNLGVRRENILMCDTKGVIYKGRKEGMNSYKERFAAETEARTLAEAFVGADVFFGLSSGNCVTPEMLLTMAPRSHHFRPGQPRSRDSVTTSPWPPGPMPSWPPAAPTIPTR